MLIPDRRPWREQGNCPVSGQSLPVEDNPVWWQSWHNPGRREEVGPHPGGASGQGLARIRANLQDSWLFGAERGPGRFSRRFNC